MRFILIDSIHFCVGNGRNFAKETLRKKRGAEKINRHGERAAHGRKRDKTSERTYAQTGRNQKAEKKKIFM